MRESEHMIAVWLHPNIKLVLATEKDIFIGFWLNTEIYDMPLHVD